MSTKHPSDIAPKLAAARDAVAGLERQIASVELQLSNAKPEDFGAFIALKATAVGLLAVGKAQRDELEAALEQTQDNLRKEAHTIAQQVANAASRFDKSLNEAFKALEESRRLSARLGPLIGNDVARAWAANNQVRAAIARAGFGPALGIPLASSDKSLGEQARRVEQAVSLALQPQKAA